MTSKIRKIIARTTIAVLYAALLIIMFVSGRNHTLLIDNKYADDGSYKAVKGMMVTVDKQEPVEFMKGDRDKSTVKGQKHTISIEFYDNQDPITFTFKIPLGTDAVLLSIPAYLAGQKNYMTTFDLYATTHISAADRGGGNEEIVTTLE